MTTFKGLAITAAFASISTGTLAATQPPVDYRDFLPSEAFQETAEGSKEWTASPCKAPFAFDELIYSWQFDIPDNQGLRLYLKIAFEGNEESPWLYAGYWGDVPLIEETRTNPTFEHGHIAMDQLLLEKKATNWQFKVISEGPEDLTVLPALHVITTDNAPDTVTARRFATQATQVYCPPVIYDLPLRLQRDSKGNSMPDRCQSAAVASAMEFFGSPLPLEEIEPLCWDPEYQYPGIWPRTLGAAAEHGFTAYIDRFRDWQSVRTTLAEGKIILPSTNCLKIYDQLVAPPYDGGIGGHIIALNGVTDDGRVFVTDSYLSENKEGYLAQWLQIDFEKVWMDAKGGVGMVICPPAGFQPKVITDIPSFPVKQARHQAPKINE